LRAVSVEPAVVDVSTADATVTVTATITDAGSGVDDRIASVSFRAPSATVYASTSLQRTAGDEFSGTLRIPAGSQAGTWKLDSFSAFDRAGNNRSIYGSTLTALGFTASFRVGAAPDPPPVDAVPPRLSALRLTPASVDVTGAPATVTVSATITDESGLPDWPGYLVLRSSSGTQSAPLARTSGDEFAGSLQIPQGAQTGRWQLAFLTLNDLVGNFVHLNEFDLADLGFGAVGIDVTGSDTADTAPPRLSALRLTPASVDVSGGPAIVTVSATITDESGLPESPGRLALRSPSSTHMVSAVLARTSGDEFAGSLQVPQGAPTGRWQLSLELNDLVGNGVYLYRFDLADLGFGDVGIDVTGSDTADTAPPRLLALRLTPASVDVSGGPATVTVSATITDESGLSERPGYLGLRSPSGMLGVSAALARTSGDEFAGSLQIPQGAQTGRWELGYLDLYDAVGNWVELNRFDLADLGFEDLGVDATTVRVSGQGRFGSDGDGQVMFSLSNDAVRLERIRGQRFAFAGDVASISGAGKAAILRGSGAWNGDDGYTFELSVVDNASWGRLEDTIDVVIRDPAGATVFTSGGRQVLKQGDVVVTPPASG
jgi:hypothetical protein